jgi:transcriptional regulator with XRE-family HTH domain
MLAAKQAKMLLVIGQNIKKYRNAKTLSQRQFSKIVGIDHSQICKIENGMLNITLFTLTAFADGLDVTVSKLLEGAE